MSITNLPVEILTLICHALHLKDWCSLRLACKALHDTSIEAFAFRYYKSVSFFVTSDGLRRVKEIAAHDIFRTRVQELWVAPILFDKVHRGDRFDLSGKSPRSRLHEKKIKENAELETRYETWEAIVADNRDIFESSTLADFLERCVARFENLITVGLRGGCGISCILDPWDDFDFHCLGGEDMRARLYPLGEHKICFRPEQTLDGETVAFSILMKAMIKYKRKIKALHADGLRPEVFHPSYQQQQDLLHFRGLETLEMTLHFEFFDHHRLNGTGYQAILDFVQVVAPTLRSLSFSQWQSAYELNGFDQISRRVEFSQLHSCHLRYIEVTVSSLKSFLRTARPTLRRLILESVCLCDKITPGNDPGPRKDRSPRLYGDISSEAKNEIRLLWQDLLQFFREQLSLHSLTLDRLGYRGRALSVIDGSKYTIQDLIFAQNDKKMSASFDADKSNLSFDAWIQLVSIDFSLQFIFHTLPGSDYTEYTPEDFADGPFPGEVHFEPLTRQERLERRLAIR